MRPFAAAAEGLHFGYAAIPNHFPSVAAWTISCALRYRTGT